MKICLEIYELDPSRFLSELGLVSQVGLKKTKTQKIRISIECKNRIINRGGLCYSINRYAKSENKYMKDNDKNEELSLFKYCNGNNLYGWAMLQKLPNKWI